MKKNSFQLTLTTLLLTTYVSCGGSMYGSDDDDSSSSAPQEEQTKEGTFRGVANATNPDVTSSSNAFQIKIENDQFTVDIFGSGPATTHKQYVRSGTRCPTSDDDTNQDGVIDATEGAAVYGSRVLALDSDLTSDGGVFPIDTQYHYNQTANVSQMPAVDVEGKVLTVEGVPEATDLPATTQGQKQDFPIACGKIQRVDE